jgi:hypothetical protein
MQSLIILRQTGFGLRKSLANLVPFPAFHSVRPILWFALTICSAPVQAQQPSLVLSVCNVGSVAIDVFVAMNGQVAGPHIASGACVPIYDDVGATIGAITAPVLFAGPQGVLTGLDQFDILDSAGVGERRSADVSPEPPRRR